MLGEWGWYGALDQGPEQLQILGWFLDGIATETVACKLEGKTLMVNMRCSQILKSVQVVIARFMKHQQWGIKGNNKNPLLSLIGVFH